MEFAVEQRAGVNVVRLVGELTDEGVDTLAGGLSDVWSQRGPRIVVDLAQVPYMNSAGLSSLINLATRTNLSEGRVVLAGPQAFVANVLEMTKLTKFFEIAKSVDEAVGRLA
jgi:anti-sigma B factor antagonist